jgi:hypothetical protein
MSFFAPGTPLADMQRFEQDWLSSQQPDMSTMVAEQYPPPSAQPFNPFSSIRQRLSSPMQRGIGQIGPYGMGMGRYGGGGGGFFPPQMMGGYGGGGFFPPQMMGGYGGFGGGFPPQMMGGYGGFPPQMMGGYGGFGGGFPPQMMGGYGGFGGGFPPQMMGGYGGFGGGFSGYPQQMMGGYSPAEYMDRYRNTFNSFDGMANPYTGEVAPGPMRPMPASDTFAQLPQPPGMSKQFLEAARSALSTPAQSSPQMSMDMAYRGPARTPEQNMIADQTRRMVEQQRMGMQQQAATLQSQNTLGAGPTSQDSLMARPTLGAGPTSQDSLMARPTLGAGPTSQDSLMARPTLGAGPTSQDSLMARPAGGPSNKLF